jgi:lipid-binding SYLF domain-containing protein
MLKSFAYTALSSLAVVFALSHPLLARQSNKNSSEAERATDAVNVLTGIMSIPENSIPEDLMARAHGIAVIPHVVKGAFGIGGQWGKGLMSQRREDGSWSAPAYIEIGGGSFGPQIGVEASDIVLVFTDEEGIKGILKGKVKLGADASATAGPVGRKAEVGTDVLLRSAVFAYSRSKGLFAGISLDGSVIGIDDSANRKIYGNNVTGKDILLGNAVETNNVVQPFVAELQKVSPPHIHIKKVTQK